eukprot:gene19849-biopygen20561
MLFCVAWASDLVHNTSPAFPWWIPLEPPGERKTWRAGALRFGGFAKISTNNCGYGTRPSVRDPWHSSKGGGHRNLRVGSHSAARTSLVDAEMGNLMAPAAGYCEPLAVCPFRNRRRRLSN